MEPLVKANVDRVGDMTFEEFDDRVHISIAMGHAPYRGEVDHETILHMLSWQRSAYEAAVRLQQLLADGFLYRSVDQYRCPVVDDHVERCAFALIAYGKDYTATRWAG
jgi:hypothetical protein